MSKMMLMGHKVKDAEMIERLSIGHKLVKSIISD